jgi:hypothetical protein
MIHVFVLVMFLGVGEDRRLISDNMYFYSIDRCNYFAEKLSRRYGNFRDIDWIDPRDRVTAYCKPVYANPDKMGIQVYE